MDEAQKAAAEAEAKKAEAEAEAKKNEPKTFTQEDVDKIAGERAKREQEKADKQLKETLRKEREDWDRQAKLSSEEKESEANKRREADSADRERGITLRENRADAREVLQSKNISSDLVDFVVDVDKDKTNENIDNLEKAFLKAVEAGVTERLKGETPKDKSKTELDTAKYGDSVVL